MACITGIQYLPCNSNQVPLYRISILHILRWPVIAIYFDNNGDNWNSGFNAWLFAGLCKIDGAVNVCCCRCQCRCQKVGVIPIIISKIQSSVTCLCAEFMWAKTVVSVQRSRESMGFLRATSLAHRIKNKRFYMSFFTKCSAIISWRRIFFGLLLFPYAICDEFIVYSITW